jgi:DNA topoisomerase-1
VSGTVITFRGFMAAYEEGRDEAPEEDEERPLPHLKVGDAVQALSLEPQGHETSPPARYTEPTLVKALEDRGIGRPSTYASILSTILDRGYVVKRGMALVPTFLAFAVTKLLEQALRAAGRLRVHRPDGGRPRPHRRGRGAARRLLTRFLPRQRR